MIPFYIQEHRVCFSIFTHWVAETSSETYVILISNCFEDLEHFGLNLDERSMNDRRYPLSKSSPSETNEMIKHTELQAQRQSFIDAHCSVKKENDHCYQHKNTCKKNACM